VPIFVGRAEALEGGLSFVIKDELLNRYVE